MEVQIQRVYMIPEDCSCYRKSFTVDFFALQIYTPVFDTFLMKKVPRTVLEAACGTFANFMAARYTIYFLVWEQIFFILAMGMICLDVQNPNAVCNASVSPVLV